MKTFLYIFLLMLVSFVAYGQASVKVRYLQKINSQVNKPDSEFFDNDNFATLTSNGQVSTYRYGQGGDGKKIERGENNNMKVTFSDAYGYIFHRDKRNKKFVSRDFIKDQPFIISEEFPVLKWEIQKDGAKEIGGYLCKKATTEFRGRVYDAWFTEEIPLDSGPWKLSGLPGLILEAKDRVGVIKFIFAGITMDKDAEGNWNKPPRHGINISFEEFFKTRQRKDDEFIAKIAAIPGVTVTPSKTKGYFEIEP